MNHLANAHDDHPQDHPEDLLDLAARGRLPGAESSSLKQHLRDCVPCADQLGLAMGAVGSRAASEADRQLDRACVSRVLERLDARPEVGPNVRAGLALRAGRTRFTPPRMAWTVGALLLSGSAAAATWWSFRPTPERTPAGAMAPPVERGAPGRSRASASPGSTAAAGEAAPTPTLAPPPVQALVGDAPPAVSAKTLSADALFRRARTQRVRGDLSGAIATYRRLQSAHAGSAEGQLSYLIVGRMYLAANQPDLAAAQFGTYLSRRGSAWQEALVGRAAAFARLGRREDERADWQALLARDPQSLYAERARARLDELGHPARATPPGSSKP